MARKALGPSLDEIRSYLSQKAAEGLWRPAQPLADYKPAQLKRRYGVAKELEAQGRTVTPAQFNQLARGRAQGTKEHPNRKKSYEPIAPVRPRAQRQPKPTRRLVGPILPRAHVRPPEIPKSLGSLAGGSKVVTHTATSPAGATSFLGAVRRRPSAEGWRVELVGYDCELARWGSAFENRGHAGGMSIDYLWQEWHASGQTFYEWMLNAINESQSPAVLGDKGLKHLCLFQIIAYRGSMTRRAS